MKIFGFSFMIIVATLGLMLIISLLFNWHFIQQHWLRQGVIVIFEAVVLYIGFRLLQELNKSLSN